MGKKENNNRSQGEFVGFDKDGYAVYEYDRSGTKRKAKSRHFTTDDQYDYEYEETDYVSGRFRSDEYERQYSRRDRREKQNKSAKKSKKIGLRPIGTVLMLLQLAATIFALVMIGRMNLLSVSLLLAGGCVLLAVWLLVTLLQSVRGVRVLGGILSFLISASLCLGSVYSAATTDLLGSVFGQRASNSTKISVVVMSNSEFQTPADLSGCVVALQQTMDQTQQQKALEKLNDETNEPVAAMPLSSYKNAVDALYEGQVHAVLLNEAYRSIIKDVYPKFDTETRVLTVYTVRGDETTTQDIATINAMTDPFTIYISGNDEYGEVTTDPGRSDVNILLTVNPKTKQILMTTTPRDYYVEIPVQGDGYTHYEQDKLTHASLGGIEASEKVLEQLYGINIDYYVKLNFSGFQQIVDSLGGVSVYSDQYFESIDGIHYFVEGENDLDGYEALLFVRERHYFENGDFQRGRNQMAMIKAIMNKVLSPAILTNYIGFMDSIRGAFISDIPQSVISDLVNLQLSEGGGWNIVSNPVSGETAEAYSYYMGGEAAGEDALVDVVLPDPESVRNASDRIYRCINGEIFSSDGQ